MNASTGAGQASLLQIGDVAERVGLSLRTVRYYEEVGLVNPAARSDGGFRLYSESDVERLTLLKSMKALGLTLEEMGQLVELVERSVRPDRLSQRELERVASGLREYARRSDDAIEGFERQLVEARQLRVRIGEQVGRCDVLLEHRRTG